LSDLPVSQVEAHSLPRRLRFQDLQRHRVRRILLVSSLYDSFILAEDGQLSETILSQFVELNLSITPDLQRVSSGAEALRAVKQEGRFDLIITTLYVGDMNAVVLASKVRESGLNIPVILLAYDNRELTDFKATHDLGLLERTFLWQGDVRILLAMVKYIEDCWNVEFDTGVAGVPAIIVVEDNVRFYSAFLPVIYTELVKHTQGLISEGLNLYQKMIRMRARPKILLCETYEEAWHYFSTYEDHILGIISDIEFPRGGHPEPKAGVRLAKHVKRAPCLDSRTPRFSCTSCASSWWRTSGSVISTSRCRTRRRSTVPPT
jgi:CheY-like chemotaxis protein